jgi:hypothetical protein
MGNVGRMDALVLALCLAGYRLIHHGRAWRGLALIAATVVVHPYALVFGAMGLLAVLVASPSQFRTINRGDILVMALASLPLVAYAAYALHHWQWFMMDMGAQANGHHDMLRRDLGLSGEWSGFALACRAVCAPKSVALLTAFAALGGLAAWRDRSKIVLLLFGAACLIIRIFGAEMWYVALSVNAILLWTLTAIWLMDNILYRRLSQSLARALRGLQFAAIVAVFSAVGMLPAVGEYPYRLQWGGMRIVPGDDYTTTDDIQAIVDAVARTPGITATTRVAFSPSADGLLFYPASRGAFMTHSPGFFTNTPDWKVMHLYPGVDVRKLYGEVVTRPASNAPPAIHSRGGHAWYLVRVGLPGSPLSRIDP